MIGNSAAGSRQRAAAATEPRIEVIDLWKAFGASPASAVQDAAEGRAHQGHTIAVRDVSFSLADGETFVIMGLSGSGKSTLIRCVSRIVEPTQGVIRMDGLDVTAMNTRTLRAFRRSKFAMVFQNFGLFPHRRVLENVEFGLELQQVGRAERRRRAMEAIELVGLSGWEARYPAELSGGMQQRVGLARALVVDPEIVFMDEPFSALDPLIRKQMQNELISLQQMLSKSLLFITHDFLEAVRIADRIAVMKDGQFLQIGTPEELVLSPATDEVRAFVEDVPRLKVLTAGSIMAPAVSVLRLGDPLTQCRSMLDEPGHGHAVPVVDDARRYVGMAYSRDLLNSPGRGLGAMNRADLRQEPAVGGADKLEDLLAVIVNSPSQLTPVVDAGGLLLGVLDRDSVLQAVGPPTGQNLNMSREDEAL